MDRHSLLKLYALVKFVRPSPTIECKRVISLKEISQLESTSTVRSGDLLASRGTWIQ